MIQPYLHINNSETKGRGVFTDTGILADTVVELSPVIVMSAEERLLLDKTRLHDYIFKWGKEEKECCMALGYIAMYNHSYTSNCEYFMDFEEKTIMIKTVKPIAAGEELTINYNGDWDDQSKVWFET